MYDVFSLKDFSFPKDFIWGAATAGHQIEGDNIHSQLWAREYAPDSTCTPSGKACNSYVLYEEDIKLLKQIGLKNYRMSIEWSRIEPIEGQFEQKEIDHYVKLLSRLCEEGIKPYVTLHHFTHPLWYEKLGGFNNEENVKYFLRYVEKVVPFIAPYTHSFNVINEFNQGWENISYKRCMLRCHAGAYQIIKQHTDATVSTVHAYVWADPYRKFDTPDRILGEWTDYMFNEFFFHAIRTGEVVLPETDVLYLPELKDSCDYWAMNFYTRNHADMRRSSRFNQAYPHKRMQMIKSGFYLEEMIPEGMTNLLMRCKDKPVIITENGLCCDDDRFRLVYMTLYLEAIKEAIDLGVDVRGFFYWSLMDNYEWGTYLPKFGIVDVDFETFKRTLKPSAYFYRGIIEENAVTQENLRKYLKELPIL